MFFYNWIWYLPGTEVTYILTALVLQIQISKKDKLLKTELRTFFLESGSGSAENPDQIRKNPDPDPWKKLHKTVSTVQVDIFSTLNTVLFGQVTPKSNKKHHLDPIGLLMDGSGFLKSGSGSAKKPQNND